MSAIFISYWECTQPVSTMHGLVFSALLKDMEYPQKERQGQFFRHIVSTKKGVNRVPCTCLALLSPLEILKTVFDMQLGLAAMVSKENGYKYVRCGYENMSQYHVW